MQLYGSLTSPYVRKVRILLQEKGIACDFIEEAPTGEHVRTINPLSKIPAFVMDNGKPLFESGLVLEYLDTVKGAPLIPATGEARWDVLRWHALSSGMLDATVARLMETRKNDAQRAADFIKKQETKIAQALDFAEQADKGTNYLVGNAFSLADIAMGVALEYLDFRYAHDWRSGHPRLAKYLQGIGARPSFVTTLPPGMERK
jgi:glutathione S-transferase